MVILSEFRMRQYRDDDQKEGAPHFSMSRFIAAWYSIFSNSDMERPREPPETFDEDFEAAEIERVFGPVDEKQQDVEQV